MEKMFEGKALVWATDLEDNTKEQIGNMTKLPMLFKHCAVMPDSHLGYGMPIGGVIALKNTIIVNAVGVDIGCGMCAVKLNVKANLFEKKDLREIIERIRKKIPVGFKHHPKGTQSWNKVIPLAAWEAYDSDVLCEIRQGIHDQLGTLGGGNHFIELQEDEEGYLWVMIHSGSRNLGKTICDYYNKKAEEIHKEYYIEHPKDLAWLPVGSSLGKRYIRAMDYALDFAKENRKRMMDVSVKIISEFIFDKLKGEVPIYFKLEEIDIHHNYAALENHMGANVWVHRKGATSAREGELGIIPGSMGTKSYIVKGKGNPISFYSCSHGGGRVMGRKQATRTLNKKGVYKSMEGIVFDGFKDGKGKDDFGEAPEAYKDIDMVMENQKDLVEIVHMLKPLAVLKG